MRIRSPGITSEYYLERDRRERIGVLFSIRKSQQEFAQPARKRTRDREGENEREGAGGGEGEREREREREREEQR